MTGTASEPSGAAKSAGAPSPGLPPPVGEVPQCAHWGGEGLNEAPSAEGSPLSVTAQSAATAPPRGGSQAEAAAGGEGASAADGPSASAPAPVPAAVAAAAAYHARASEFAYARCRAWLAEAETLAEAEPDFDLAAVGRSRVCTALLRAGLPLRDAWRAANVDAVARRAAADARAALCADIRARGARPTEAGAAAVPAFAARPEVGRLSDAEVRDVLGRVARRERVSFG